MHIVLSLKINLIITSLYSCFKKYNLIWIKSQFNSSIGDSNQTNKQALNNINKMKNLKNKLTLNNSKYIKIQILMNLSILSIWIKFKTNTSLKLIAIIKRFRMEKLIDEINLIQLIKNN